MILRHCLFLALFFNLGISSVFSQTSIDEKLSLLPDDTTKVVFLSKLVDSLRERSSQQALQYAMNGKQLSERLSYKKGVAQMLEIIAWLNYRNSDLSTALEINKQALAVAKEAKQPSIVAKCLIGIAAIHFDQENYPLAIIHFRQAAIIGNQQKDIKTYARSINNIGFAFIQLKQYDSATYYTTISYNIAKENKEYYVQGFSCRNFGEIAVGKSDWQQAVKFYKEGWRLADESNNNYLKVSIFYRLGNVYNLLGKPELAIPMLQEAIALGKKNSYRDELERSLKAIAESYAALNEYSKAFSFQREYISLHDSLVNQKKTEQLVLAQARFDSEMKQAQIELLTRDAELQQRELGNQKILTYFFIGFASLLLILMFVLWSNNKQIKGAKRILEQRNNEVRKQAEQLTALNITKDKLFSIISHDLRSPLAGLKSLMELISRNGLTQEEFFSVSKTLRRNIDSVYDDLENLLQWAQTQLNGIKPNPTAFDLKALVSEKLHLFEELAKSKHIDLINGIEDRIMLYADKNQIGLVLRNLLANAIKFSMAKGIVKVTAQLADNAIILHVKDDGVGMSLQEVNNLFNAGTHFTKRGTQNEKGIGLGLLLVKEFIEKNKGTITVSSELGKGSTFSITLRDQSRVMQEEVLVA
jgi:two-component system, sensor histidine kinase and response regulator